nr:MAG TPA: aurora kinase [Caudoviricetes sp.]
MHNCNINSLNLEKIFKKSLTIHSIECILYL